MREEQLEAEQLIKQLRVSDLLIGTLASLVQLGYAKLGEGEADEARLAIEALRALLPVLEGAGRGGCDPRSSPGDRQPAARVRRLRRQAA